MANVTTIPLMTAEDMKTAMIGIAAGICLDFPKNMPCALVGIKSRGIPMANYVANAMKQTFGREAATGTLDINLYRDDLSEVGSAPVVKPVQLPFDINGMNIILFDDVLFTGRTIRAAMDALIDHGRPATIKLAVMVDRGFREFPIQADYVGKRIQTTLKQNVKVCFEETDGKIECYIKETQ